jgi:chromosome segregation ATPase
VYTPEFLDFVKLLRRGSFSLDGIGLGLLSKHLKQATTAKQSSQRVDENTELRQRIAAMEKDYIVMEQRLQTAQRDCKKAEGEIGLTRSALSEAEDERSERESELKRLRIETSEFRRLGAEEKEVRRLNRELMTLQDRFEEKARDCTVLEMTLCIARKDNAKLQDEAAKAPRPSNYLGR